MAGAKERRVGGEKCAREKEESSFLLSSYPLSLFSPFPSPFGSCRTGYDLIDRIDRLIDRKAKEVMGNEFFVSNHIILVTCFASLA